MHPTAVILNIVKRSWLDILCRGVYHVPKQQVLLQLVLWTVLFVKSWIVDLVNFVVVVVVVVVSCGFCGAYAEKPTIPILLGIYNSSSDDKMPAIEIKLTILMMMTITLVFF